MISDVLTMSRGNAGRGEREHPGEAPPAEVVTRSAWGSLGILKHLSHEIRTPLQSLLALTELLREGMAGELNPEQQRYLEVIERSGQCVIRMVNDVLDLSRMELGQINLQARALDLGEQISATVAALAPLADARAIALSVKSGQRAPLVHCDPGRVRQVLTILLEKAIAAADRGQVVLSIEPRDRLVAVHVSGAGEEASGATPSDGDPTHGADDSDVGLAIAGRLVRLMGGELTVESGSAEAAGSRFTFTLPVGKRAVQGQDGVARDSDGPDGRNEVREKAVGGAHMAHRSRDDQHGTNPTG